MKIYEWFILLDITLVIPAFIAIVRAVLFDIDTKNNSRLFHLSILSGLLVIITEVVISILWDIY